MPAPRTASFTLEATTRLPPLPPAFFAAFAMSVGTHLEEVEIEASAAFQGIRRRPAGRSRIAPRAGFRSETGENVARATDAAKKSILPFSVAQPIERPERP